MVRQHMKHSYYKTAGQGTSRGHINDKTHIGYETDSVTGLNHLQDEAKCTSGSSKTRTQRMLYFRMETSRKRCAASLISLFLKNPFFPTNFARKKSCDNLFSGGLYKCDQC